MNNTFLSYLLTYLTLLPVMIMSLIPMSSHLKAGWRRTILRISAFLAVAAPAGAWVGSSFTSDIKTVYVPLAVICFILLCLLVNVPAIKIAAGFAWVFAFIGFLSNISSGFYALLLPSGDPPVPGVTEAAIRLGLCTAAVVIMFFPLRRYAARLMDELDMPHVWAVSVAMSCIFLTINIIIRPKDYAALYSGANGRNFWITIGLLGAAFTILSISFHYIVETLITSAKLNERNRILEMQDAQYEAQQRYIDATARARHDHRQFLYTISGLSASKNYTALDAYIRQFTADMPVNEIRHYCDNNPLNALLNHYAATAAENGISYVVKTALPESCPVSDVDLCSMTGNILENAIYACSQMQEGKKLIELSITTRNDMHLFIVATNTFDGRIKKREGMILPAGSRGSGIGLRSISAVAESYGGSAAFSYKGNEFYTDIMIPLR